jgi:hypothetical protein
VEAQLCALQARHAGASATRLPSGAHLVTVPHYPVPPGWNQAQTTIGFIAPVGYPYAKLDCFWADPGLRLATGAMPLASNSNPIPETALNSLWFSWHLEQPWNPNADNLLTWLAAIGERLRAAR